MLTIYKLRQTQISLRKQTRTLRAKSASAKPAISTSEAEGYELQPTAASTNASITGVVGEKSDVQGQMAEEGKKLRADWIGWKDAVVVNA